MTEQLRKKIAEYICGSDATDPFHAFDISNAGARVNYILALIKEAGYARLAEDQTLPTTELGLSLKQVTGLKQRNWRKVILEVKE